MIRFLLTLLLIGSCLNTPNDALSQSKKDTLKVCLGKALPKSLDPATSNTRQVLTLYHNWGDTLLYRDPVSEKIVPGLAESYRILEDGDMELTLKKGVWFHNGEPFNAAAVKFSLDLLKKSDSKVSGYLRDIKDIVIEDYHNIRIEAVKPIPTLSELIANVLFIYPPGYYQKVGKKGFGMHPVGTGPYRLISNKGFSEMNFERNPRYFGGAKGMARIPNLKIRIIKETIPQMEALISGEVDLIRSGSVDPEQVMFLKESDRLKILSTDILRVYFLVMDAQSRSGATPFKNKKVRQAVNHAINREKIARDAFNGFAHSSGSVVSPLQFGYENQVVRYPYDPSRARQLLDEAGYPDGFEVDYYAINNESAAENILKDLRAVGIRAKPKWMMEKWDQLYKKFLNGKIPLAFLTWGSYSIFDASALLNHFFMAGSPACYGTTPEIDRLLKQAMGSKKPGERAKMLSEAQKLIAEEAFWVPICSVEVVCAMDKDLQFQPAADEIDRYFLASWPE
ncbi:MAG TPA: ABC transporter substrate-binding protein [Desulfobacteria bacterium]|nr:ABC transporter substrate-binding protein [Desulfobacteria bacterium]